MRSFLVDENLSPLLARWLTDLGYPAYAVRDIGLKGASDEEIIRRAQKDSHILITSDLDFGEFFYGKEFGNFGVIILRSVTQGTDSFQIILEYLHTQGILNDPRLENSLLVATKNGYRWRKFNK